MDIDHIVVNDVYIIAFTKILVSFLPSDRDVIGKLEIREIGAHLNATTRTQLVQAQFDICS